MTKKPVMDDDDQNNEGMMELVALLRNFLPDLSDDEIRALASQMIAKGNAMKQGEQNPLPTEDDNMNEEMEAFRKKLEAAGLKGDALEDAMRDCAKMCGMADDEDTEQDHEDDVVGGEEANKTLEQERRDGTDPSGNEDDDITGDEDEYETAKAIAEAMFRKTDKSETVKEHLRSLGFSDEVSERATRKGDDQASDEETDPRGLTCAQDRAVKIAVDRAVKAERIRMMAMDTARRDVMPLVGEIKAMDSASAVYRHALRHLGMDTKGINTAGLRSLVKQQVEKIAPRPIMVAADSATKGYSAPRKL